MLEDEFCAFQSIERVEVGHQNAQCQRHQCNGDRNLKAVQNGVVVIGLAEELDEIVQREACILRGERLLQQSTNRVDEEKQER